MDDREWLAQRFEDQRAHLRVVAYRLLGSTTEAEDAVQEAWLRVSRAGAGGVENLGGWLTTVVSRVCLNMLETRRSRREEPLELHAPEPVVRAAGGPDHEQDALLADAVGPALLVVLETLDPAERLAFVLHDVFGVPFDEIATIVGRSAVAARQLASRTRRRVQGTNTAPSADRAGQRAIVEAFLAAARRRFQRVAGPARSRRCAAGRPHRGDAAPSAAGRRCPWRDGRRPDLLGAGAGRAPRLGRRRCGHRLGGGRHATHRLRLHDRVGEDRRHRSARRPCSASGTRRADPRP